MRSRATRGIALAAAVALAGCGACRSGGQPDAALPPDSPDWLEGRLPPEAWAGRPKPGGTLVVRAMSEPGGFNLLHDSFRAGWGVRISLRLVVEALMEIDPVTYELKPALAESWEERDGGRSHVFRLRDGVRFHDGAPFSSRDVKAVFDAVLDPKLPTTAQRALLADLDGYEAPDGRTFVVRWKRRSPLGFRELAKLPIYPAASLQGDFDRLPLARRPLGTGPFQFESWESGRSVAIRRFDGYWGDAPYLERIEFRILKDHTVATQLFERGELDLMTSIQPQVWRSMESPEHRWARGYHRIRFVENAFSYIAWNARRPFFADRRVRYALAHLFPADVVAKNVDLGLEVRTTCPYWVSGPYCDSTVEPVRYDPAAAARLLDEAGWKDTDGDGIRDKDGVAFRFDFLVPPNAVRLAKLGPLMQTELARVGIDMRLEQAEGKVISARLVRHEFDAVSRVWVEFDVEQDLTELFHSKQVHGSNIAGYANSAVDALLDASRSEPDLARRVALNRRIHRLVYDDQPYLWLTARPALDAAKKHVKGLRPSLVWYDLRRVWLDDGQTAVTF